MGVPALPYEMFSGRRTDVVDGREVGSSYLRLGKAVSLEKDRGPLLDLGLDLHLPLVMLSIPWRADHSEELVRRLAFRQDATVLSV